MTFVLAHRLLRPRAMKKKLRLRRDTLRRLDALTLGHIAAAGYGATATTTTIEPTDTCQSNAQGCRTTQIAK